MKQILDVINDYPWQSILAILGILGIAFQKLKLIPKFVKYIKQSRDNAKRKIPLKYSAYCLKNTIDSYCKAKKKYHKNNSKYVKDNLIVYYNNALLCDFDNLITKLRQYAEEPEEKEIFNRFVDRVSKIEKR